MCKIGVVGYGIVGKSIQRAASHVVQGNNIHQIVQQRLGQCNGLLTVQVWDAKLPSNLSLEQFARTCDLLVPSPGVPSSTYENLGVPYLSELELFARLVLPGCQLIGITGSLGKTTITRILTRLLAVCMPEAKVVMGGNIGIAMLDLLDQVFDVAVLELSSFQLYKNLSFAPSVAIVTNLYQNHLDWHGTVAAYAQAKAALLTAQKPGSVRILDAQLLLDAAASDYFVPLCTDTNYKTTVVCQDWAQAQVCWQRYPTLAVRYAYLQQESLYVVNQFNGQMGVPELFVPGLDHLPESTFAQNWAIIIVALCALLGPETVSTSLMPALAQCPDLINAQEHRIEHFATYGDVLFFNDSKSTLQEATYAAVAKLVASGRPLHLVLGGLGKGVDRSGMVERIRQHKEVVQVVCWGPESAQLQPAKTCTSLQQVVDHLLATVKPGDQVLFSPSGTSLDAFANYQQRGQIFKLLVHKAYSPSNTLQPESLGR